MKSPRAIIPEPALTHLKRHQSSGLSIATYCRENDIRPATFYGWNKRYKKTFLSEGPSDSSKLPFIEIPVKHRRHTESDSTVRIAHTAIAIPSAALIELGEAFNEYIKVLLAEKRSLQ